MARWPGGHRFAFTVFDDADFGTLESVGPLYRLLTGLGLRVTKTVWPLAPDHDTIVTGDTCERPEYVAWLRELEAQGHELAWHGATHHSSTRERTLAGLDRFREAFGHDPRCGADHGGNAEALYWGARRLSGVRARAYRWGVRLAKSQHYEFSGDDPQSPYFWGDLCHDRLTYYRNFTVGGIDTLAACPMMPYHDPERPWVPHWFAASEGQRLHTLCRLLDDRNLDRLEAAGGACIVYAHLGLELVRDGEVVPEVRQAFERVARRDGWFAPTGVLLDHLRAEQGDHVLSHRERSRLEWRWLLHKAREPRTV